MSLAWSHRWRSQHHQLAFGSDRKNQGMTLAVTGSVDHWTASIVVHVEVCVGHRTLRMDGAMSACNVIGCRPQSEGLYCPPLVYVQCLLPCFKVS